MLSLLPDYADPRRLCALGKAYQGSVPLAQMPRLTPLLTSSEGEAAFTLAFDVDDSRRPVIRVSVRAEIRLECQRCLGTLVLPVASTTTLAVVSGPEEAERLPDDLDPLLVENDKITMRTLIEDELILAVPTAPAHAADVCPVKLADVNAAGAGAEADHAAAEDNPFAALADWKGDDRKPD
jgi:uncharacterized protein